MLHAQKCSKATLPTNSVVAETYVQRYYRQSEETVSNLLKRFDFGNTTTMKRSRRTTLIILLVLFTLLGYSFYTAARIISFAVASNLLVKPTSRAIYLNSSVTDGDGNGNKAVEIPPSETNVAVDIPLNRNSSFVQLDVSKIIHIPSKSRIEVHLKPTRRCKNPLLKGRISGWSLSMIEFENITDDKVVGHYDLYYMPLSGNYYIEILTVLCEKYGDGYRSMNLREPCLEIAKDDSHQLTAGNGVDEHATIYLEVAPNQNKTSNKNKEAIGRWLHHSLHSDRKELLDENDISQLPRPLPVFTPHQAGPAWCNLGKKEAFCDLIGTNGRQLIWSNYTYYEWNSGSDEVWSKDYLTGFLGPEYSKGDHMNVCFMGASHSRVFRHGCNKVRDRTVQLAKQQGLDWSLIDNLKCTQIDTRFPALDGYPEQRAYKGVDVNLTVSDKVIRQIDEKQCTHIVLGLFQWYFSYQNLYEWRKELTFNDWKAGMKRTVQMIQESARSSSSSPSSPSSLRKIYLRSAHANGFGSTSIECPPKDFRTPVNAKIATEIIAEIVDEVNNNTTRGSSVPQVSFLDTSPIIDGRWDSSRDWSHYSNEMLLMETKFILSTILRDDFS